MDWRTSGKCANLKPESYDKLFFPEAGRSINKAKAFCNNCPVLKQCLEQALTNREQGIWAGTTEADRSKILAFRNQLNNRTFTEPRVVKRTNFVFS